MSSASRVVDKSKFTQRKATISELAAAKALKVNDVYRVDEYELGGGGGGCWRVVLLADVVVNNANILSCSNSQGKAIVLDDYIVSPLQYGYSLNAPALASLALVAANWAKLKLYINDVSTGVKTPVKMSKFITLKQIHANWISGTRTPLGFYSDSTTDGAKTTGHIPSTSSDVAPFSVTINESPLAYPRKLQDTVSNLGASKTLATTYNGGFDSESYRSGFGLQHWYNTWFRGLSGSNVDWSDVAAIVLGFGVSDSANVDDTASVIANYSMDIECTILDCLLRGVQPILQAPTATVQHYGNTLDARNADQINTIINAVQNKLKDKYNLEQLAFGEAQVNLLDGFRGIQYGDIVSASANDQVHPVDMGHRIQAGSIVREMNAQIVSVKSAPVNIMAGGAAFKVVDESLNVTTNVLTRAVTEQGAAVERIGEYFYKFPSSVAGEVLLEVHIYCEKPALLFYMPIDSSVEQPSFLINSLTHDDNDVSASQGQFRQPVSKTFSKMYQIASLAYGLNRVLIKASSVGGVQNIGGLMAVPSILAGDISFYRESAGGTVKLSRNFTFRDNRQVSYGAQALNSLHRSWQQYMPQDNQYVSIAFTLDKGLDAATEYSFYSHFTDHLLKGTSYNKWMINADTVTIFKVVDGVETQVATVTTAGVNLALVAGAAVMFRVRTRFYNSTAASVQLHVNGVQLTGLSVLEGDLWTCGYGLELNNIQCHSVSINSIESLRGNNQDII